MAKILQPPTIHQIVAENLRIGFATRFPMVARNLTVQENASWYADQVEQVFTSFLLNIRKQDKEETTLYQYPATAWDFLKEKYAPNWFLKRWPIRYATKTIATKIERNFMCPHLDVPNDTYRHMVWMSTGITLDDDYQDTGRQHAEVIAALAKTYQ